MLQQSHFGSILLAHESHRAVDTESILEGKSGVQGCQGTDIEIGELQRKVYVGRGVHLIGRYENFWPLH